MVLYSLNQTLGLPASYFKLYINVGKCCYLHAHIPTVPETGAFKTLSFQHKIFCWKYSIGDRNKEKIKKKY